MQCTAHAKRTGKPCQKHARVGYQVCAVHGAGYRGRPGGRPLVHGAYSRFLQDDEVMDFEYFKAHFSLEDDLAFATVKTLHALDKVEPSQLATLLQVPSKIALRKKQIVEGLTLRVEVDLVFLNALVERIMQYVPEPTHQTELRTFIRNYLGETAPGPSGPAADA